MNGLLQGTTVVVVLLLGGGATLDAASSNLLVALNTFYGNTSDQVFERVVGSTGELVDNILSDDNRHLIWIGSCPE